MHLFLTSNIITLLVSICQIIKALYKSINKSSISQFLKIFFAIYFLLNKIKITAYVLSSFFLRYWCLFFWFRWEIYSRRKKRNGRTACLVIFLIEWWIDSSMFLFLGNNIDIRIENAITCFLVCKIDRRQVVSIIILIDFCFYFIGMKFSFL